VTLTVLLARCATLAGLGVAAVQDGRHFAGAAFAAALAVVACVVGAACAAFQPAPDRGDPQYTCVSVE
jgi:hypothetical protein